MSPHLHMLNPAGILCAIRDGKAKNIEELEAFFGLEERACSTLEILSRRALHDDLNRLAEAGFIEINGETILATPLIEKLQAALRFSLSELAANAAATLRVKPLFGPPSKPAASFDIFVIMPFVHQLAPIYESHIKNAADSLGLTAVRADDSVRPEAIVKSIWDGICSARLIIADCTGANPNVLYEIGIAHTVGKPVILITQSAKDIPYDLTQLRSLVYGTTRKDLESLEKRLRDAILEAQYSAEHEIARSLIERRNSQ